MFDLVLGTGNQKKLLELRLMLPEQHFRLQSLAEIAESIEVEETGDNLCRKRSAQSGRAGTASWSLGVGRRQRVSRRCAARSTGRLFGPICRSPRR